MSPSLSSRRNSSRALLGVRSVDASGSPSWVIVCMQSAKAVRTVEKVWFRSGGTSVRPLPFSGWAASPRDTRVWAIASCT